MIYKTFLLLLSLGILGTNGFRKCAEVEFCNKLRNVKPADNELFDLDVDSFSITNNGEAVTDLVNKNGKILHLHISGLSNDNYRIQIDEDGKERYKLQDTLDGEPKVINITQHEITESRITLITSDEAATKLELVFNPLVLNSYKNTVLESTIDLNQIYFDPDSEAFSFRVQFPLAQKFYGLHEHADHLSLQDTNGIEPYRFQNVDYGSYEIWSPRALYGTFPILYGQGVGISSGIFLHNAAQQWIDLTKSDSGSSAYFMAEGGSLDLFTLPGPTPRDILRTFVNLTGTAHLPQLWALGYHQCRFNYESQEDVKNVVAQMDQHDFPMDVIWLDIDYTDGRKYFTWDPTHFSDPEEMQQNLSTTNRKLVTIIDPHIKVDLDYSVYKQAFDQDLFVKNENGTNYEGNCWPGLSSYLDFLNPATRDFYANQFSYENFPKSTETLAGIWNDMNEPSVFGVPNDEEGTIRGSAEHINGVKHRDVHNIYGFLQTKGTHQGLIQRDNGSKRPFILTRSSFAGSQRYAAVWTGDNVATWNYLQVSIPMCLTANLVGHVFCGADVGGFHDNPTDELFQRWYQTGVWLPFFRAHSDKGTNRREPYLFSEDVQKNIRNAIKLRYKHLPVWYTLFYQHTQLGDPLIRPLVYHYPDDQNVLEIDNEFLLGENILIHPVTQSEAKSVSVYFPEQDSVWYQLDSDQYFEGVTTHDIPVDLTFIPIFYKSQSIIVRKDVERSSTVDMIDDPYSLYINLNKDNEAFGSLYLDDFTSFDYATNNTFTNIAFSWSEDNSVIIEPISGSLEFSIKIDRVIVNEMVNDGKYKSTTYDKTRDGTNLLDLPLDVTQKIVIEL